MSIWKKLLRKVPKKDELKDLFKFIEVKKLNTPYKRGYRFQNRVKRLGEKLGYMVFTSPKSNFPDQIWLHPKEVPWFIECKVKTGLKKASLKTLLSKDEINRATEIENKGFRFSVAFKDKERGKIHMLNKVFTKSKITKLEENDNGKGNSKGVRRRNRKLQTRRKVKPKDNAR